MIIVQCQCGQVLKASPAFVGTKVTCPKCRKAVTISEASEPSTIIEGARPTKIVGPTATPAAPKPKGRGVAISIVAAVFGLATALAAWQCVPSRQEQTPATSAQASEQESQQRDVVQPALAGAGSDSPLLEDQGAVKPAVLERDTPTPLGAWQDARQPIRVGNCEVSVERVSVGRVQVARSIPAYSGLRVRKIVTTGASQEECLAIHLAIRNLGDVTLAYSGWDPSEVRIVQGPMHAAVLASLEPGVQPVGKVQKALLGPGQEVHDLLVFKSPDSLPDPLQLELDAERLGAAGPLRLSIPRELIAR